jgi:hypothetical protein
MLNLASITIALALAIDPGVPRPDIWQAGESSILDVSQPIQIVVADDATETEMGGLKKLIDVFEMKAQIVKASEYRSGKAIHVGESGRLRSLGNAKVADKLKSLPAPGKEGYRIIVDSEGIILAGTDPLGTRHGLNYLALLLDQSVILPPLSIQDEPDVPLRFIPSFSMRAVPGSLAYRPNAVLLPVTESQLSNPSRIEKQNDDLKSVGLKPIIVLDFNTDPKDEWASILDKLQPQFLLLSRKENGDWPACTANHDYLFECVTDHIEGWRRFIADVRPGMTLLVDAELFMPFSDGGLANSFGSMDGLSTDVWLYVTHHGEGVETTVQWLERHAHPFVLAIAPNVEKTPDAQRARIFELLKFASANRGLCKGLGALRTPLDDMVLQYAWNMDNHGPVWPAHLNAFFGSELGQPGAEEVMKALIDFVNKKILAGVHPENIGDEMKTFLKAASATAPNHRDAFDRLQRLVDYIVEYLQLEQNYVDDPNEEFFGDLIGYVRRWAEETKWPEQRTKIITETVREKKLMVPASIIFGNYVAPYRPGVALTSGTLLPLPATITDNFSENYSEMKLHTGLLPIAPIRRFDFETVGTASTLVETSQDGDRYRTVYYETTEVTGGMRAPVLLDDTYLSPWWTFRVNAPYEKSHLRNFRAWAWKPPADAKVLPNEKPIEIDGNMKEPAWNFDAQVFGFVDQFGDAFSTFPTTVKLARQNESLFLVAQAVPETDGEELSLLIRPSNGATVRIRLVMSKKNTAIRFTRNGIAIAGFAEASLRPKNGIWTAEIRIPLSNLGVANDDMTQWNFNAVRLSRDDEFRSIWAPVTSPNTPLAELGTLTF